MAEVGVLELTIHDNSEEAGTGLTHLATALSGVNREASGFDLTKVASSIKAIVDGVKDQEKVVGQLANLFNALKGFSKIKSFENIDTEKLSELKSALSGMSLGVAGTQLKNLREAIAGQWKTDNISSVTTVMGSLQSAAAGWKTDGTATTIKAVAESIEKYNAAIANTPQSSPFNMIGETIQTQAQGIQGSADQIKQTISETSRQIEVAAGDWRSQMAAQAGQAVAAYESKIFKTGYYATKGLSQGELSGVSEVSSASEKIANTVVETMKTTLVEQSPSRVTYEIGAYAGQGFINGLQSKAEEAQRVAMELAQAAVSGVKDAPSLEGAFTTVAETTDAADKGLSKVQTTSEKVSEGVEKIRDCFGRIDWSRLNVGDYIASPMEYAKYQMSSAGNAIDAFRDKMTASIPAFRDYRDAFLSIRSNQDVAGFSRKTTDQLLESVHNTAQAMTEMNAVSTETEAKLQHVESVVTEAPAPIQAAAEETKVLTDAMNGLADSTERMSDVNPAIQFAREWNNTKPNTDMSAAAQNDIAWINNLINTASEADLVIMKIDDLRSKLVEGAAAGNMTGTQIANAIEKIRKLEATLDDLQAREREVIETTHEVGNSINTMASTGTNVSFDNITDNIRNVTRNVADEIQGLFDRLENPPRVDLSHGVDQMLGIGSAAKDAADSMSVFLNAMAYDNSPITDNVRQLNPELNELAGQMRNTGNVVSGETLPKLIDLDGELKKKKSDIKNVTEETKRMHFSFKDLKKGIQTMFPTLSGLIRSFTRMAKMRAIRALIRQIAAGFREGVQNVYEYSKVVGTDFAPSMDSAASSLATMKNSIGAMAAPLIQTLIPILQRVVNWFINLTNYVNQFISLMRGQATWTRALPQTTTAFNKQEKAAKGAGAAIKDLLADWDELNIIQSESGSGGVGTSTQSAEDYLSMFEQVDEFNDKVTKTVGFIKDNLDKIKDLAKEIGVAILAWKISTGFAAVLGDLIGIVGVGAMIKITFDTSELMTQQYLDTGDAKYLAFDGILTAIEAALAYKFAEVAWGETAGHIAGSVIISISAATSFFASTQEAEDEAKSKTLLLAGAIKAAIATALLTRGFYKFTNLGLAASFGLGAIIVGLTIGIAYYIKMKVAEMDKASEVAKEAFAATGEGGINPGAYISALQTEFDRLTEGSKIILKAYIQVPDMKKKLEDAVRQIVIFNTTLFNGEGKLSDEDAASFNANWELILSTLDEMSKASYETLLGGVISALRSDNAELRKQAEEARINLIMARDQVSEARAAWIKDTEDLKEKIKSGDYSEEDLEKYKRRVEYITRTSGAFVSYAGTVESALERYDVINFGDKDTAFGASLEFLTNVANAMHDALDNVNEAKAAIEASREDALRELEELKPYMTEEEYQGHIAAINIAAELDLQFLTESESEIKSKLQDAYDIVFKQMMSALDKLEGQNKVAYMRDILGPMMQYAEQMGYTYPKEIQDRYGDIISQVQSRNEAVEELGASEFMPAKILNTIFGAENVAKYGEIILGEFGVPNKGTRIEDIQRYNEDAEKAINDNIESAKQAIRSEIESGTALNDLYGKYVNGDITKDMIDQIFDEVYQNAVATAAEEIKSHVLNDGMTWNDAKSAVEGNADVIEKAFGIAFDEITAEENARNEQFFNETKEQVAETSTMDKYPGISRKQIRIDAINDMLEYATQHIEAYGTNILWDRTTREIVEEMLASRFKDTYEPEFIEGAVNQVLMYLHRNSPQTLAAADERKANILNGMFRGITENKDMLGVEASLVGSHTEDPEEVYRIVEENFDDAIGIYELMINDVYKGMSEDELRQRYAEFGEWADIFIKQFQYTFDYLRDHPEYLDYEGIVYDEASELHDSFAEAGLSNYELIESIIHRIGLVKDVTFTPDQIDKIFNEVYPSFVPWYGDTTPMEEFDSIMDRIDNLIDEGLGTEDIYRTLLDEGHLRFIVYDAMLTYANKYNGLDDEPLDEMFNGKSDKSGLFNRMWILGDSGVSGVSDVYTGGLYGGTPTTGEEDLESAVESGVKQANATQEANTDEIIRLIGTDIMNVLRQISRNGSNPGIPSESRAGQYYARSIEKAGIVTGYDVIS